MLTMLPPLPRAIMRGATARVPCRTVFRLARTRASQPFSLVSRKAARNVPPTLLTSTSTPPKRSTAAATARSTASPSRTSVGSASAAPPARSISAAVACAEAASSSRTATRAPKAARPRAIPLPMPAPAPVTSATRPVRDAFPGSIALLRRVADEDALAVLEAVAELVREARPALGVLAGILVHQALLGGRVMDRLAPGLERRPGGLADRDARPGSPPLDAPHAPGGGRRAHVHGLAVVVEPDLRGLPERARFPLAVVVVNLAVTVGLGAFALHLRIENSLESMLPAHDPKVEYYAQTRAIFGSDEVGVVGVRAQNIFAPATIEKVARVTDLIAKVDGVERVLSIANAVDPAADVLHPPRLLPRIPPEPAEVEALKRKLAATPLYGKNLVSDDFTGAAINIFFKNLTDAQYLDLGIDRKIGAILAAERGPEEFFYTGAAHVKQAAVELMRRDLVRFTPVALVLVLIVLWFSFRTVRGVILPVLTVGGALVWTLGIIVLAGKAITLGTFVLPPLLLVVGSSYAIHVMARHYEQVAAGAPPAQNVLRAFTRVWLPLTISAVTTVIGFGSLMVNRITAIWDLGLFAVVGVVGLALTCLTFLPAALQLLPSRLRFARSGKISPTLSENLRRLGERVYTKRRQILWAGAV